LPAHEASLRHVLQQCHHTQHVNVHFLSSYNT
jgi:hypothetical protein